MRLAMPQGVSLNLRERGVSLRALLLKCRTYGLIFSKTGSKQYGVTIRIREYGVTNTGS